MTETNAGSRTAPRQGRTQRDPSRRRPSWRQWLIPSGLILLCLVPIVAGALRLTELTTGAEVTPQNARFFASPVPVVVHIVSVTVFSMLGAFQFVPALRRGRPSWHRMAGRILVPSGLLAALSGLWMNFTYPRPDDDGALLFALRVIFGSAMVLSIVLGFRAILRRNFRRHSAWMTRGYAIGLGAGTQVFTGGLGGLILGVTTGVAWAVLMGAGWVINLAVAEYVIRRRTRRALLS